MYTVVATYLWCILGIVISVLLPILWQAVYKFFPKPVKPLGGGPLLGGLAVPIAIAAFWKIVMPYVVLGIASAVTAILIVAVAGDKLANNPAAAILAGYAWDSTLQKLMS